MNLAHEISIPTLEVVLVAARNSASSVCFNVVSASSSLGRGSTIGSIDVHYPCAEPFRLFVRAILPERLLNRESIEMIVAQTKPAFDIPAIETMEVYACTPSNQIAIFHKQDGEGRTRWIETTRNPESPDQIQ